MSLNRRIEQLRRPPARGGPAPRRPGGPQGPRGSVVRGGSSEYDEIKRNLHNELLDSLDFEEVGNTPKAELYEKMRSSLTDRVEGRNLPLSRADRERMVQEILDNVLGLGPIEPLLRDPAVSDILINGPKSVYIDRKGKLLKTEVVFDDEKHLLQIIERIVVAVGRRVDEQNPMVDARMADGSRFNAIIQPLSLDGAAVSIRRFGKVPIDAERLIEFGSCPRPMMETLRGGVHSGLNCIISGGTGSGKTTLLNVLSSFIPPDERIITIEDSAELQLQQPHVVRLETRPANLEGKGEVTQRELVKNCLRMRPDRIILGEIRGGEAIDMLTAMNTGHDGSLATVHANNTRDALARFETMVGIGMPNMTPRAIRETIARALDVIVQQSRLTDGSRRVVSITEVTGMEGEVITTQDIFMFNQEGVDKNGKVRGRFMATGIRPNFASRLASHGIILAPEMFEFQMEV
ncbi:MAG TPA: CpaF family protein [Myxococcota bacterium]|nr:CpaF family protein [Myxococcota bacterium]